MRPADMTDPAVLAERHCHGTRVRYMTGCKCVPCRAANSRYETDRAAARKRGDWNGIISAEHARQHLLTLSSSGIGRRLVSEISGLGNSTLSAIKSGDKAQIRARTAKRIFAVTADARAGRTLVKAGPVWTQINRLLREGFTKAALARRLGYKRPALQIHPHRVTAKNAMKVERLHAVLMAGAGISLRQRSHSVAQRRA